jgi:hypothetical protein
MNLAIESSYLTPIWVPSEFTQLIESLARVVRTAAALGPLDAIAFRGVSGCAVGFPVGFVTGMPMIVVRKPGEDSHRDAKFEGVIGYWYGDRRQRPLRSYVILDDFVGGGATCRAIAHEIRDRHMRRFGAEPPPTCVGVIAYRGDYSPASIREKSRRLEVAIGYPVPYMVLPSDEGGLPF